MSKLLTAFLLLFILSACANYETYTVPSQVLPNFNPAPTPGFIALEEIADEVPTGPNFGGTLRLTMRAPRTLNPLLNEDATVARILQLMFEPLILIDEEMRPIPHLASLEFAFTGASVVVTIREDAYWSDGTPISARDIIFSLNTLRNAPSGAIYRQNVSNFAHFEAISDRSVRIVFDSISGGSAYLFNFPIIPRHHFEATSPSDFAVIGNGPFMFDSYTNIEALALVQNPYSFRNRPYINDVHVLITNDSQTDRHAFDRGLVDIYLASVAEWSRHHSVKPVQFAEYLTMQYEFIGFKFARQLPRIQEFREAIALSLDIESMVESVFLIHATVAKAPIHPVSSLYYQETPIRAQDMAQATYLAEQVLLNYGHLFPTTVIENEDEYVEDETVKTPISILVNRDNVEALRIAQTVAAQMNEIGFYTEVDARSFTSFEWLLNQGQFDLFVGTYNLSLQPDLRFAFHSESSTNLLSYNDPELDRLLDVAAVAGTENLFYRAIADIQLHLDEQLPVISLAFSNSAVVIDRRIHGEIRPLTGNIFANVEEWFIP